MIVWCRVTICCLSVRNSFLPNPAIGPKYTTIHGTACSLQILLADSAGPGSRVLESKHKPQGADMLRIHEDLDAEGKGDVCHLCPKYVPYCGFLQHALQNV